MKFGRNLARNQVPEWASSYIKYKALKKLIKSGGRGREAWGRGRYCWYRAKGALSVVTTDRLQNFSSSSTATSRMSTASTIKNMADAARRLKLLQDRYGHPAQIANGIDKDDFEDLMGALLELRGGLKHLQWYGEVNRRGFIKITKKLDKKVGQTATQKRYLETKVDRSSLPPTLPCWRRKSCQRVDLKACRSQGPRRCQLNPLSHSLQRVTSKTISNLQTGLLESMDQAIRNDDAPTLVERLSRTTSNGNGQGEDVQTALCLSLLQRAVTCRAKQCTSELLSRLPSLEETTISTIATAFTASSSRQAVRVLQMTKSSSRKCSSRKCYRTRLPITQTISSLQHPQFL